MYYKVNMFVFVTVIEEKTEHGLCPRSTPTSSQFSLVKTPSPLPTPPAPLQGDPSLDFIKKSKEVITTSFVT